MTDGEIRIVHAIPGRVRLKVAGLKATSSLGVTIQTRLRAVPGIRAVETNPLTGSVLVFFDPEALTAPASLLTLSETLTDLFPELDQTKLAEFLTQSLAAEAAGLTWSENLADFLAGLSGRLAGVLGSLTDLKILLPLTFVFFGLPFLLKK
jgi:hypothetical protein